jgi:hypothetical protein
MRVDVIQSLFIDSGRDPASAAAGTSQAIESIADGFSLYDKGDRKNTDFQKQTRIVRKSLYVLIMATAGTAGARAEIERLGQSHGRYTLCD